MHRHANKGRKFSRTKDQRTALLRGLATSIVLYEKVKTTLPKAKEARSVVEKLITTAKKNDLNAVRDLNAFIYDKNAIEKLLKEIAPLYKDRKGGYTRIVKVGNRVGDNAEMAIIELIDTDKLIQKPKEEKKAKEAPKKEEKKPAAKAKKTAVKEKK